MGTRKEYLRCKSCKILLMSGTKVCPKCGSTKISRRTMEVISESGKKKLICPKCQSDNVAAKYVEPSAAGGFIGLLMFGIPGAIFGSLFDGKWGKHHTCNYCGHSWK